MMQDWQQALVLEDVQKFAVGALVLRNKTVATISSNVRQLLAPVGWESL
jgi:hypothetical protein